MQKRLAKMEQH
jgi:hypothetical protein